MKREEAMSTNNHQSYIYAGLAGEGLNKGEGGMYRLAEGEEGWVSIDKGLPENPQVRSLALHPDKPNIIYAGTQSGVYRSDDRGEHWEALEAPRDGMMCGRWRSSRTILTSFTRAMSRAPSIVPRTEVSSGVR